jgi:hypothetical protein
MASECLHAPAMRSNSRLDCAKVARFIVAVFVLVASSAEGQDLEPRAYSNAPVGLNFVIAGYGYTAGGVATDPALPIENAKVEVHSGVIAYARTLDIFGKSAKVDVVLPYARAAGSATALGEFRDRTVSGLADPRFHFSVNFYGAPALSIKDFANYRQDVIVGASLEVTVPGGQYDADKLLNLGTNRWSIKPEIGISKSLGPVILELAGGVRFYTDNDNFFGSQVREQAPIYSFQGHLIYSFGYGIWGAVDGTYYTGGRTTVDGVEGNDLQQNSRVGVTLALPVSRYNSIKLYFSTGVSARTGSDFDAAGIAWQTRFGGGL